MKKLIRLFHTITILIFLCETGNLYARSAPKDDDKEDFSILGKWIKWSDSGSLFIHHLNEQAINFYDARKQHIEKLKTKNDWLQRQKEVKNTFTKIVGPFPEKTALNPQITGVLQKDGYRVEKIVYESIPGFYVTACLFIPAGIRDKRPTVIHVSGHTVLSFREPVYQTFILNLVKKGFIVFAIEPIGQGERDQYFDPGKNESVVGQGVHTHTYVGDQCFVSGSSLAKYFIWDVIRGLDYLETREEVDMQNIGIAGRSGGGTQTAYAAAFDDRIKATAPEAFITSQQRLLESPGLQDAESNLYQAALNKIEHADFIEVRAPKPAMIVTTTRDYFSIQGARETYREAKKTYDAFGKPENLILAEDDYKHGSTQKNREAVYGFFQKFLNLPGNPAEEKVQVLSTNELQVTVTGQVSTSFGGETVFTLNKKATQKLIENLEESRKNIDSHLKTVVENAKNFSGFIEPESETEPVFCGRYNRPGYCIEMYVLPGEGRCVIPTLLFVPESEKTGNIVYLHPDGKSAALNAGNNIIELVKSGYVVAVPDVSGTGETRNTAGRYHDAAYNHHTGYAAMLAGRSLVGIRAGDIIRVTNFLKKKNFSQKTGAVAVGETGPVLLHAATFNQSLESIVLIESPLSYQSMVLNRYYKIPFSCTVTGALKAYDLPDLLGAIAPRKVVLVDPNDYMLNPANSEVITTELQFPREVFSKTGALENLMIQSAPEGIVPLVKWSLDDNFQ